MRRRRLNILIVLLVLTLCRLLHDRSVAPATAELTASADGYPTTAPATIATDKDRDPSWDWLLVRNVPTIDAPSDATGRSTELAGFVLPRIRVFPLPEAPALWNRSNHTDETVLLVGGFFDDHLKTPSDPWIGPPAARTPHDDDVPVTRVVAAAPPPALAISSDPPTFDNPPPAILIQPPAPVGGPDSLPPAPGPVSTPTPEPNSIIVPLAILLLARRFPARG